MADSDRSVQRFKIESIVSRPFMENTYVMHLEGRNDCLVIDPGFEPEAITDYLTANRLIPAAILNTHGHADHIAGNEFMKRCWPECPLVIGAKEVGKLADPQANLSAKYGFSIISPPADEIANEGDIYKKAGFELEVLDTPGHSSGHVVFVWKQANPWIVIGGDVLFQGSIGRYDLPDGSFEQLKHSIQKKLFIMPDNTIVLPGHGDATTIGEEREFNPFVGERAGAE